MAENRPKMPRTRAPGAAQFGSRVQVYDYSPTRNQHNESPQNQFAMTLAGV